MSLSAFAIAVEGVGFSPDVLARAGLWDAGAAEQPTLSDQGPWRLLTGEYPKKLRRPQRPLPVWPIAPPPPREAPPAPHLHLVRTDAPAATPAHLIIDGQLIAPRATTARHDPAADDELLALALALAL